MEGKGIKLEPHQIAFLNKRKAEGHTYGCITVNGQQVSVSFYDIPSGNGPFAIGYGNNSTGNGPVSISKKPNS